MTLRGAADLQKRLRAIGKVTRDSGREWQTATVRYAREHVPVRTGATRTSIRPGRNAKGYAAVIGKYTVNFIDAGSKAHEEPRSRFTKTGRLRRGKAAGTGKVLRFRGYGHTVFARKVHKRAIAPRPFKKAAARYGLQQAPMTAAIVMAWNKAA